MAGPVPKFNLSTKELSLKKTVIISEVLSHPRRNHHENMNMKKVFLENLSSFC